MTKSDDQ